MSASLGTPNLRTLNLKCQNKSLQNIFTNIMSQINWYSEKSIDTNSMNTVLSINCLTVFDHFMCSVKR